VTHAHARSSEVKHHRFAIAILDKTQWAKSPKKLSKGVRFS